MLSNSNDFENMDDKAKTDYELYFSQWQREREKLRPLMNEARELLQMRLSSMTDREIKDIFDANSSVPDKRLREIAEALDGTSQLTTFKWMNADMLREEFLRRFPSECDQWQVEGFPEYNPDSPIDNVTQVAYLTTRQTHSCTYPEADMFGDDLRLLYEFVQKHSEYDSVFVLDFAHPESNSNAPIDRDEFWFAMYAATRIAAYTKDIVDLLKWTFPHPQTQEEPNV